MMHQPAPTSRLRQSRTRNLALMLLCVMLSQLVLAPLAWPLTVEEQAGRKGAKERGSYTDDDFSKKAPERRDTPRGREEKDPRLACLLSLIIPGGGHIYLRKDLKGAGCCIATTGAYSVSLYYLYLAFFGDSSGSAERKTKMVLAGVLFVAGVILHAIGIVEAYNDAVDINEKSYYYGEAQSKSPYFAGVERK